MTYTIAIIEDLNGEIKVNFDKTGNKYLVGIYHNETKEYTYKEYSTHEEAKQIYIKLTTAILEGTYSYEDRKKML